MLATPVSPTEISAKQEEESRAVAYE